MIRYYAKEFFISIKPKDLPKKSEGTKTNEIFLEDLLSDDRVSFSQSMMLINTEHTISDDFAADVAEYKKSGVFMNTCIMKSYESLALEVFNRFNEKLYVRSAYRSAQEQQKEIEENSNGTATIVGASEHQVGLSLDVYVPYFAGMGFLNSPAGEWVNESCGDYGFIIRYPYYGKKQTGIDFEPWHIRYVGFPHANLIMKNHLTLEEYVDLFEIGKLYEYGDYIISRQSGESFLVPDEFEECVASVDNCGNYFLTFKK